MTRVRIFSVVALAVLVATSTTTRAAWVPPVGSPLANREHPRILLTNQTLPAIKAKLASGGVWHDDFRTWLAWADGKYATAFTSGDADLSFLAADYAFLWLTYPVSGVSYGHSRTDYGTLARDILLKLPTTTSLVGNYDWYGLPAAYDWIYPLLSTTDKATLVVLMKTIDLYSFVAPDSNPFNSQVTVARAQKMLSALAIALDGVDDAWAQATLDRYPEYYSSPSGVTRSESDLGGEDGTTGQGASYGLSYTGPHTLLAEEGWRTANGITLSAHYAGADKSFIRRLPQHFAYLILPWATSASGLPDNRRHVLWKTEYFAANSGAAEPTYQAWLTGLVGLMKNVDPQVAGLTQWLLDNRTGQLSGGDSYYTRKWSFWKFIMGDRVVAQSPVSLGLPVSRSFKDGKFVFRTGWDDINDSYVTFTANEWMRSAYGMSPNYPGGFTIDRKGPQVIRQGGYSGHDWGSLGAGPANILLFVDRSISKPTSNYDDEGGHRIIPGPLRGSRDFVQNSLNDVRDRVRFLPANVAVARDADYVSADVTRAYNSTRIKDDYNPARVSDVVRQMVYFRPNRVGIDSDRVIVFDRATTTDVRFEKRWLFHTSGEPLVNGSETAGQPVRNGTGQGKWTYTGATRVTATNTVTGLNGRTFLTPLLPASRVIVKVGGPNAQGLSWQTDSHEFESPYGVIYPRYGVPNTETEQYIGRYRVEIIPTTQAIKDVFLNVVEVSDANTAAPTSTALLPGIDLAAVRVGDRVAAFGMNTDNLATGEFTVDAAGTYRMHLADLVPSGVYEVTIGGAVTSQTASTAGTLYVESVFGAGTRVALRLISAPAATPPSPPTNVRIVR